MRNPVAEQPHQHVPFEPSGGLHLPRDVGTPASVEQAVEARWSSTIGRVNARMYQQGFYDLPIPQISCPEVTTDALMTTDMRQYTVVYEGLLRWYNYAAVLYARCRATLLGVDNAMGDIAAKKRIGFRQHNQVVTKDQRLSVAEMDDSIDQDPVYNDLKLQQQELQQFKLQLETRVEGLERSLRVVSRQIEIRKTESQSGNRMGNMPSPGPYPGPQAPPQGQWGGR